MLEELKSFITTNEIIVVYNEKNYHFNHKEKTSKDNTERDEYISDVTINKYNTIGKIKHIIQQKLSISEKYMYLYYEKEYESLNLINVFNLLFMHYPENLINNDSSLFKKYISNFRDESNNPISLYEDDKTFKGEYLYLNTLSKLRNLMDTAVKSYVVLGRNTILDSNYNFPLIVEPTLEIGRTTLLKNMCMNDELYLFHCLPPKQETVFRIFVSTSREESLYHTEINDSDSNELEDYTSLIDRASSKYIVNAVLLKINYTFKNKTSISAIFDYFEEHHSAYEDIKVYGFVVQKKRPTSSTSTRITYAKKPSKHFKNKYNTFLSSEINEEEYILVSINAIIVVITNSGNVYVRIDDAFDVSILQESINRVLHYIWKNTLSSTTPDNFLPVVTDFRDVLVLRCDITKKIYATTSEDIGVLKLASYDSVNVDNNIIKIKSRESNIYNIYYWLLLLCNNDKKNRIEEKQDYRRKITEAKEAVDADVIIERDVVDVDVVTDPGIEEEADDLWGDIDFYGGGDSKNRASGSAFCQPVFRVPEEITKDEFDELSDDRKYITYADKTEHYYGCTKAEKQLNKGNTTYNNRNGQSQPIKKWNFLHYTKGDTKGYCCNINPAKGDKIPPPWRKRKEGPSHKESVPDDTITKVQLKKKHVKHVTSLDHFAVGDGKYLFSINNILNDQSKLINMNTYNVKKFSFLYNILFVSKTINTLKSSIQMIHDDDVNTMMKTCTLNKSIFLSNNENLISRYYKIMREIIVRDTSIQYKEINYKVIVITLIPINYTILPLK
jgi:hypothetical protein